MIDLTVPGDPRKIRDAGDWLSLDLAPAADDAAYVSRESRARATSQWTGEAAAAFTDHTLDTEDAAHELKRRADDAAEKFRSYAGQLERMTGSFDDLLDRARDGGLRVVVRHVHPPTEHTASTQAEMDEQVALYEDVLDEVERRFANLSTWVSENLAAFLAGLPREFASEELARDILQEAAEQNASLQTNRAREQLSADLSRYEAQLERWREWAADPDLDIRLGPHVDAARHATPRVSWLDDVVRASPHLLPVLGPVIDLTDLVVTVAQGDDPVPVLVEMGVGGVAGMVVGSALVAAGAGVGVIALGTGVTAVAVGGSAAWLYEEAVPQDVREAIAAGIEDFLLSSPEYVGST